LESRSSSLLCLSDFFHFCFRLALVFTCPPSSVVLTTSSKNVSSLDRNSLDTVWRHCFCSHGICWLHTCRWHFGSLHLHATGSCHLPVLLQVWPCHQSLARPWAYSWGYDAHSIRWFSLVKSSFVATKKRFVFVRTIAGVNRIVNIETICPTVFA
jgi:hypothetical protein